MDLEQARSFLRSNHRGVLTTRRRQGSPQMSPVSAGIDGEGYLIISTREPAMKVRNLRLDPRASYCGFTDRFFGAWVQVDGRAEIVSLPEAMEELVTYYRLLSGEHPDWDDYRDAMVRDRRCLIRITLQRAGPSREG